MAYKYDLQNYTEPQKTGSERPNSILTEGDVVNILETTATKSVSFSKLAKQYGCSKSIISGICRGKRWRHVTSQLGSNDDRKIWHHNTSGATGVSFDKNAWIAYVTTQGVRLNLGRYKDKQMAVECRRDADALIQQGKSPEQIMYVIQAK